jgi:hypothetical protein
LHPDFIQFFMANNEKTPGFWWKNSPSPRISQPWFLPLISVYFYKRHLVEGKVIYLEFTNKTYCWWIYINPSVSVFCFFIPLRSHQIHGCSCRRNPHLFVVYHWLWKITLVNWQSIINHLWMGNFVIDI